MLLNRDHHQTLKFILKHCGTSDHIFLAVHCTVQSWKKAQMSARGRFEGSEMSSKVRDFRPKKIATKVCDLMP